MGLRALRLAHVRSTYLKSRRSAHSDGTSANKVIIVAVCFLLTMSPDLILLRNKTRVNELLVNNTWHLFVVIFFAFLTSRNVRVLEKQCLKLICAYSSPSVLTWVSSHSKTEMSSVNRWIITTVRVQFLFEIRL